MLAGRIVLFTAGLSKGFALKAVVTVSSAIATAIFGSGVILGRSTKKMKKK